MRQHDSEEQESILNNQNSLNAFLASVEKRAFRIAEVATANREDALDIVQDAMLRLSQKYAQRPTQEWGPLFHRILQNCIMDWHRKHKVKQTLFSWLPFHHDKHSQESQEVQWLERMADTAQCSPEEKMRADRDIKGLMGALHQLPIRQQQAFLLRSWEGLNTKETAIAMGVTEGSVKTHYSRAVHTLKSQLEEAVYVGF